MASRFVSGGTLEKPTERDDEWLRAQQELEETRRQKTEESKQNDGKTLYEVLQQNKGTAAVFYSRFIIFPTLFPLYYFPCSTV